MKKKILMLALVLTAVVGLAAASNHQGSSNGSSLKDMASNYWVVTTHWFGYNTYVAPAVVYSPYVAAPAYSYSYYRPVYRYHYYYWHRWHY
jgi:hypothetical protein